MIAWGSDGRLLRSRYYSNKFRSRLAQFQEPYESNIPYEVTRFPSWLAG